MAEPIKISSNTYVPPVTQGVEFTTDDRLKLNGIEANADVTDTANVSDAIIGATTKASLVDADTVAISDSASSNLLKKVTFTTIKSFLKTYFDTLYNKYVHPNHSGDVTSVADGLTTIANNVVGNTKLADVPTNTIKGRVTTATGDPEDLTPSQVRTMLNVADGANNYTHPSSHSPSIITQDASNRFVTDTEKSTWNAKAGTSVATTSANGLMSSTDKTKVDGIESGAEVNNISDTNATDLTDGTDTTLHYHSTDRNRANHTGTQTASTISDFASTVRSTVLTGLSTATNAVVVATDSILVGIGKLQKQITDHLADAVSHITSTERTNWNSAYTNNHSHSNKATLDATTASFLVADETKLDGISTGANKVADSTTNGNILIDGVETNVYTHPTGTNPHGTTKADVGLGSADNTADSAKNVLSATKLTTARTINGVSFDGTANITVADSTKVPTTTTVNGHALSGNVTVTASDVGLGNVNNTSDLNKPISTATQTALDGKSPTDHLHDDRYYTESEIDTTLSNYVTKQSLYTTTTATTEGWYRVATVPIGSQYKNALFKIKAYTASGTSTESTVTIDVAYNSANYGSQYSSIMANTSHSYNSQTNAENGFVLLYCRVSFDANYGYIDFYKYKTTAVTIEIKPLIDSDWVFASGALTVNPTVGAYKAVSITLSVGLQGSNINAGYANSCNYSQYGVLGTNTLSNTTDKTGQWEYFGNWYFEYNASYLHGKSGNIKLHLQEVDCNGTVVEGLDDFLLTIKLGLSAHINSTEFNTFIPTIDMEIEGKTTLNPTTDIVALVYSTSTSTKYIRFYVKLKSANTVYLINPEQRYGRSFNTSNVQTTSFSNFNFAGDQTPLTVLPTPAQGSITYATWRQIDADTLDSHDSTYFATADHVHSTYAPLSSPSFTDTPTAPTATTGTNTTQIATTAFVQNTVTALGAGDMTKAVYDADLDGIVDNAEKVNGHTVDKDVPSNAVFTDTVYTHPTTTGYKHIPSGGASGQVLKYSADGTAIWGTDNDTIYTHPTTSGNKHIPSGGASGQVLKYSADGTAVWGTDNDTIYTHPTTTGNKHVPSGGASGQILRWSADGTAVWGADNDTVYTHPATHPYSMITDAPTSLPASNITYGTTDLTAGSSALTTGNFYFVYQ